MIFDYLLPKGVNKKSTLRLTFFTSGANQNQKSGGSNKILLNQR